MSKNAGVRVRTGVMDTLSNKPCRNCGILMDDAGAQYICLSCGYKLDKLQAAGTQRESTAWEKQVANLDSRQNITARQAAGVQMLAGLGSLRILLFIGLAALAVAAPLQNLYPLIDGRASGPLALATAGAFLLALGLAAWVAFGQPGERRMLQRNVMILLALACLAGLVMSGPVNQLLASQYAAMHNRAALEGGGINMAAKLPLIWQASRLLGGSLLAFLGLAVICHLEARESQY